MLELAWNEIKGSNNVPKNWLDIGSHYIVYILNDYVRFYCRIEKNGGADQVEFETYYKDLFDELSFLNTGYEDILQWSNADNTGTDGDWYYAEWDYELTENVFLFGGHFQCDGNANFGDKVDLIIEVPGIGVVATYVKGRFVRANENFDLKMQMAQMKFLPTGLILRIRYYSKVESPTVKLTLDYYFYRY